ncbi:MAG: secondary thiamine-phosphate synthase enzyme YjbQ [Armatimonadetes bacterium]|nr:secondary thiamine-phosphate synthase enzyme YjbQ [Armatimonadota bacterium]MDW8121221.1 secondary thiamine-phosphate synthase enzyme YjbQ [Armatimonadota bacterium]
MGTVKELRIATSDKNQLIDVTDIIQELIEANGIREGLVCLYVPHSGAAISIHRSVQPEQGPDLTILLEPLAGGSASSFAKAAIVAPTEILIVHNGRLAMDRDQRVFFYEFDGPAERRLLVYLAP